MLTHINLCLNLLIEYSNTISEESEVAKRWSSNSLIIVAMCTLLCKSEQATFLRYVARTQIIGVWQVNKTCIDYTLMNCFFRFHAFMLSFSIQSHQTFFLEAAFCDLQKCAHDSCVAQPFCVSVQLLVTPVNAHCRSLELFCKFPDAGITSWFLSSDLTFFRKRCGIFCWQLISHCLPLCK